MPQFIDNLTQTWNETGVTKHGIKLNVTDTDSAADSLLLDLKVGGNSKFTVGKDGKVVLRSGQVELANESSVGLTVKGLVAQTGNLTEWQDGSGNIVASVNPAGRFESKLTGYQSVYFGLNPATGSHGVWGSLYGAGYFWGTLGVYGSGATNQGNQGWRSTATVGIGAYGDLEPTINTAGIRWNNDTRIARDSGGGLIVTSALASAKILTVKGAAAQTANLTEWQDSAGIKKIVITSAGNAITFYHLGNMPAGTLSVNNGTGTLEYQPAANYVGLMLKGSAGQTANLQEWRDNSGVLLSAFRAGGSLTINGALSNDDAWTTGVAGVRIGFNSFPRIMIENTGNKLWEIGVQGSNFTVRELSTVRLGFDAAAGHWFWASPVNMGASAAPGGRVQVTNTSAATIALLVKGAVSQTANLQEWQDSVGAQKAYLMSTGQLGWSYALSSPDLNGLRWFAPGSWEVRLRNETSSGDVIIDYNTVEKHRFTAAGSYSAETIAAKTVFNLGLVANTSPVDTQLLMYGTPNAPAWKIRSFNVAGAQQDRVSIYGRQDGTQVVFHGNSNQGTTNITEWRNSSAAVLAAITPNGHLGLGTGSPDRILHLKGDNTSSDIVFQCGSYATKGYFAHYHGSTLQLAINRRIDGVFSNVNAAAASMNFTSASSNSYITFYTSNVDNTNPPERMRIDSLGRVGINAIAESQLHVTSYTASEQGVIVRGAVGQTANLQEWQGSGGTVLASINSIGALSNGYGSAGLKAYSGLSGDYTPTNGVAMGFGNYWGTAGMFFATDNSGVGEIYNYNLSAKAGFEGSAWYADRFWARQATGGYAFAPLFTLDATASNEGGFYLVGTKQVWGSGRADRIRLARTGELEVLCDTTFTTSGAAKINTVFKGYASQSANLTEWQNSSGSVLNRVLPGGGLHVKAQDPYRSILLENNGVGTQAAAITFQSGADSYTIGIDGTKFGVTAGLFTSGQKLIQFGTAGFGRSVHSSDSSNLYGAGGINSEVAPSASYPAFHALMRGTPAGAEEAIRVTSGPVYTTKVFAVDYDGKIKTNQTSAGTTLGSVTDKMAVYDAAGTLVGYVPIYDTIT